LYRKFLKFLLDCKTSPARRD